MIRAKAIDENTVQVEIISHDYRIVRQEKETLNGAIPARDRYWNGNVWVVRNPEKYIHLWFIDHALRNIMPQLEMFA